MALGLAEPVAYALHRELLASGLGLLMLATASGHNQVQGLEAQWLGFLDRCLSMASVRTGRTGEEQPHRERVEQRDLFLV